MAESIGGDGVFVSDAKTVTSAGTAEALGTTQLWSQLVIIAKAANTGNVFVGGSNVASSTNAGMAPGDALTLSPKPGTVLDLAKIYIDVATSGEGVDFYGSK